MSTALRIPPGWRVLMLPGWQDSAPGHWQSRWEALHPACMHRVQQADWHWPRRGDWMARLEEEVLTCDAPAVLVAHSLGCHLAVAWAAHSRHTHRVRAALMVAPPDTARPDLPPQLAGWRRIPQARLPWAPGDAQAAATVLYSEDDPYCSPARATEMARHWALPAHSLGRQGQVNADRGLGNWPAGLAHLQRLLDTVHPVAPGPARPPGP